MCVYVYIFIWSLKERLNCNHFAICVLQAVVIIPKSIERLVSFMTKTYSHVQIVRELHKIYVPPHKGIKQASCLSRDFFVSASIGRLYPPVTSPLPRLRNILLAFTKLRGGRKHKRERRMGENVNGDGRWEWRRQKRLGPESRNNIPLR